MRWLLVLALCPWVMSGCGDTVGVGAASAEIRSTITQLYRAQQQRDYVSVCRLEVLASGTGHPLTEAELRMMAGRHKPAGSSQEDLCIAVLHNFSQRPRPAGPITIGRISVTGSKALARVSYHGRTRVVPLALIGGHWRLLVEFTTVVR